MLFSFVRNPVGTLIICDWNSTGSYNLPIPRPKVLVFTERNGFPLPNSKWKAFVVPLLVKLHMLNTFAVVASKMKADPASEPDRGLRCRRAMVEIHVFLIIIML